MERTTRRTLLLSAAAAGVTGLSGCVERLPVGSETRSPEEFERCTVVNVFPLDHHQFPEPAETEVRTAIENGSYTSDEPLYTPKIIDTETAFLKDDEITYYRASVSRDGETRTLEVERAIPTHGEHSLDIINAGETELTGDMTVMRTATTGARALGEGPDQAVPDQTVLADETLSLGPGEEHRIEYERFLGTYVAVVSTADDAVLHQWSEDDFDQPFQGLSIDDTDDLELLVTTPQLHGHVSDCWPGQRA